MIRFLNGSGIITTPINVALGSGSVSPVSKLIGTNGANPILTGATSLRGGGSNTLYPSMGSMSSTTYDPTDITTSKSNATNPNSVTAVSGAGAISVTKVGSRKVLMTLLVIAIFYILYVHWEG